MSNHHELSPVMLVSVGGEFRRIELRALAALLESHDKAAEVYLQMEEPPQDIAARIVRLAAEMEKDRQMLRTLAPAPEDKRPYYRRFEKRARR